jgi:hypothetical protein
MRADALGVAPPDEPSVRIRPRPAAPAAAEENARAIKRGSTFIGFSFRSGG